MATRVAYVWVVQPLPLNKGDNMVTYIERDNMIANTERENMVV